MINPLNSLHWIDETFESYLDEETEKGTELWQERNENHDVLSGSMYSTCRRKAFYLVQERRGEVPQFEKSSPDTDLFGKKIMFLGTKSESYILDSIKDAVRLGKIDGELHVDQQRAPVHLRYKEKGLTFGSTTDGVLQIAHPESHFPEEKPLYIPIELKQTDRPSSAWWKRSVNKQPVKVFEGKEPHKRQLTHWMHLARLLGLEVPYGILHYNRRLDYDSMAWIFYYSEYEHLLSDAMMTTDPEHTTLVPVEPWIIDHNRWREEFHDQLATNSYPPQGTGLSTYDCTNCPYKQHCWAMDGDPRVRDKGSGLLRG